MWPTGHSLIIGGIAALGALPVLLPRHQSPVRLTQQQVDMDAEPDRVFQRLTSFEQNARIVERSADQIVAEFPSGSAGTASRPSS